MYLPRGMDREISSAGAVVYRLSRMLDPVLLKADRAKLEKLWSRARVNGQVPELAGLTLDELGELLHGPESYEAPFVVSTSSAGKRRA